MAPLMIRIKFVDELPQWITSSDVAAYHPHKETIWIKKGLGFRVIHVFTHEFTHWIIHKFLGNRRKLHDLIDRKKPKVKDLNMNYRIIKNQSLCILEDKIRDAVMDGWEPVGSIVINPQKSEVYATFLQPMIKRK